MTGPERSDPTDPAALISAAQAIGVEVDGAVAARLAAYLDAMLAENRRVNLTAIRDPGQALWLHAVDSLAIHRLVDAPPAAVFDLGTGNGFPGVAAAALWPGTRVVLCDRTRKKVDAIGRAAQAAALEVEPVWLDVAQVHKARPELCGAFDLVVARAVSDPVAVSRLALPLLAPGGRLLLWLTADDHPPVMLTGELRKLRREEYRLELPEPRARAVIAWQLPG